MSSSENLFSFGVRLGIVFVVQSAGLSAASVVALLTFVAYNSLRNTFKPPAIGVPQWRFLRTAVDYYLLSLFFSDLILSIGSLMNIKWIAEAFLTAGTFCTVQGVLKQVGNVGVALSSLVIAGHTSAVLFFRWRAPQGPLLPSLVLAIIWIFIILITVISSQTHKDPEFYGPSTYWCWINKSYRGEQIGLEYAILWFTAFVNLLLYVPLFLCLRGNIDVDTSFVNERGSKPRIKITWKSVESKNAWAEDKKVKHRGAMVVAKQMLAYPIVYIILILPMSIVRWIQFTNSSVILPSEWTAFAGVFFSASGFVNVLLYVITRWKSLMRLWGGNTRQGHAAGDVEGGAQTRMPQVTMMDFVPPNQQDQAEPSSAGFGSQYPASPSSAGPVPPMPMLSDDDDDDDDNFTSPTSPTTQNHARTLSVPLATDKSSWTSEGSKNSHGRSSVGHGNEKGLPYRS